jgi:hypothetical protein
VYEVVDLMGRFSDALSAGDAAPRGASEAVDEPAPVEESPRKPGGRPSFQKSHPDLYADVVERLSGGMSAFSVHKATGVGYQTVMKIKDRMGRDER